MRIRCVNMRPGFCLSTWILLCMCVCVFVFFLVYSRVFVCVLVRVHLCACAPCSHTDSFSRSRLLTPSLSLARACSLTLCQTLPMACSARNKDAATARINCKPSRSQRHITCRPVRMLAAILSRAVTPSVREYTNRIC